MDLVMREAGTSPGTLIESNIQPMWHLVQTIRQRVGEVLASYSPVLRTAAMITASELVENAIKYGDHVSPCTTIQFSLAVSEGVMRMRTVNGSTSRAGVDALLARIIEVSRSADKEALYLQRMQQVLACPGDSGRLGIYRIAFEAGFDLACEYENHVVTMTATRPLR